MGATSADELRHNATSLGLTEEQARTHDRLMRMNMSGWPDALKEFCETANRRKPVNCGDGISVAVARWMNTPGASEALAAFDTGRG